VDGSRGGYEKERRRGVRKGVVGGGGSRVGWGVGGGGVMRSVGW